MRPGFHESALNGPLDISASVLFFISVPVKLQLICQPPYMSVILWFLFNAALRYNYLFSISHVHIILVKTLNKVQFFDCLIQNELSVFSENVATCDFFFQPMHWSLHLHLFI